MLLYILVFVPLIWTSMAERPHYCHSKSNIPHDHDPLPPCSDPTLDSFKKDGRSILANVDRPHGLFPSWINIELARKGQKFALNNLQEIATSHLYGLITSTYYDGILLLMFTGKHNTMESVAKRYFITWTQTLLWYQDPMFDSNTGDIITSLNRVRSIHIGAAEAAAIKHKESGYLVDDTFFSEYTLSTAMSGPFFEDLKASKIPPEQRKLPPSQWTNISKPIIPMNQQTQALTQFAFIGYPILFPERIGIDSVTDDELWAFNHLWAVLGYALGIKDEFNIALQPDLATAKKVYKGIWETFNVPNLFNMDEKTKKFIEHIVVGNTLGVSKTGVNANFILYLILTDLFAIEAPRTFKTLPPMFQSIAKQLKPKVNHKRTPAEEELHNGQNKEVYRGFYLQGTEWYGPKFSEREYRANHVHTDEKA